MSSEEQGKLKRKSREYLHVKGRIVRILTKVQISCWKDNSRIEPVYSRDKVPWLTEQIICCLCVREEEFM